MVGAERDDGAEAVVEGYQVCEGCQVGHLHDLIQEWEHRLYADRDFDVLESRPS